MDPRRLALLKATIDTPSVNFGLLQPELAQRFLVKIKEQGVLSSQMRQDIKRASSGTVDKLSTASRIIRSATENSDDGYRVGATFGSVGYVAKKIRLPWEITEDVFHENIEGEAFETTMMDQMTQQFALDLEDLAINGDTASADPFVGIDDGLIKVVTVGNGAHIVDGSTINTGNTSKDHFFAGLQAMPNRYRNALAGRLKWIMSPARQIDWWQYLTDRGVAAGDELLSGRPGTVNNPLGIGVITPPAWPDSVILLADPRNFIRVVTWEVRKRRITGETDAQLAALDKRFYIWFMKLDTLVVEEFDAVVRINNLAAP